MYEKKIHTDCSQQRPKHTKDKRYYFMAQHASVSRKLQSVFTRCKIIIWHKNIIMWLFMCNVYVLISWRFGHNMKPFLVYFASNIQPTLVRYIVLVCFQLRNNKQRVKMFTRIWNWLIKCSNPIKPEGLFRKFDHAHIQTKFIS